MDARFPLTQTLLGGRYIYHYAELPENKVETILSDFERHLAEHGVLYGVAKRRKGRQLLYIWSRGGTKKVYEDEIKFIIVSYHNEVVENPKWKYLFKDLGFNELTELLYNREQELKSTLTKDGV